MELNGVNVIVTGVSRGIGRAIALTYMTKGGSVIGCATDEARLKSLRDESRNLEGTFHYVAGDLTTRSTINQLVATAEENFSQLDVLVNNAGILGPRSRIADYPDDTWKRVIDVNLNAMFHLTKALLPRFISQGAGRIINITSGVGLRGYAEWGAYSVSKFGVEGFTQILADELKEWGIEVNAVNPGPISTDMRAEAYPDEQPDSIPSPEEIMEVFLYLAYPDTSGMNGKRYEAQKFRQA